MKKTLLIALIITTITSISSFALDCNSIGEVKTFGGHYYAKTSQRSSFDAIRVSAMNDNGYLAIPNSEAENNFIKSMVGGNTEAWIGIFDPNYSSNYCYDNAACSFDDLRFKDAKGLGLAYKKWGVSEPNNFVEEDDIKDGVAEVNPLGENWVTMDGNTGKWYDVGNHKGSTQNPRKHIAIIEFDSKPICFLSDDGPSEVDYQERVCNTKVYDDNVENASEGVEANCLFDINGKEYCPQGLADAASYWAYMEGTALTNTAVVTDYAQGEYKELTSSTRDFMDGFAVPQGSTAVDYQAGTTGTANVGVVRDYQNGTSVKRSNSVWDYTSKETSTQGTVTYGMKILSRYPCAHCDAGMASTANPSIELNAGEPECFKKFRTSGFCTNVVTLTDTNGWEQIGLIRWASPQDISMIGIFKKGTTNTVTKCPSGYTDNGSNCQKLVSFDFYQYTCPASYTASNVGFTAYNKTDPNHGAVNWITLDDAVNSETPPSGNCYRDVTYSYYNYNCPTGYTVNDGGLFSSCNKTDPNNTTNDSAFLGQSCNSATPPAGNCTKIIPFTFYSYECSSGYTAIDKGLNTCIKTDSSSTSDSSGSLSTSCNSATPPAGNCYKDISYNHYTYSCPAGYAIANYGLDTCPKTDPNTAINNENSLNDNCNESVAPIGNCSKSIEYSFYEYVCTGANNQFNEAYAAVNGGMKSCSKTDTDLVNTNADLANSCNDSVSPANNCRTTEYTCNSEIREPVFIDNKWQCSPYPCYGNENMEDLSQNVGSLDKDDNGWQEDGKCSGTIYIFNGKANECRSSDKFFGLAGGGCCKDDKYALGLFSCKAEEKELQIKKKGKKCHEIGEYCSKKISLGFAKICVRTSKSYCCFNSILARLIGEQGREQLTDIEWGRPENPNCRGFTVEEFQRLDLGQMDLTEFTDSIVIPDVASVQQTVVTKINAHVNLLQ